MRHFVAYHNSQRMGRSLHDGDPLGLLTDKPVSQLVGNTVWFVVGDGESPKRYSLGSVFVVNDAGETVEGGFKRYARGEGHVFLPMPLLQRFAVVLRLLQIHRPFQLGRPRNQGKAVRRGAARRGD